MVQNVSSVLSALEIIMSVNFGDAAGNPLLSSRLSTPNIPPRQLESDSDAFMLMRGGPAETYANEFFVAKSTMAPIDLSQPNKTLRDHSFLKLAGQMPKQCE